MTRRIRDVILFAVLLILLGACSRSEFDVGLSPGSVPDTEPDVLEFESVVIQKQVDSETEETDRSAVYYGTHILEGEIATGLLVNVNFAYVYRIGDVVVDITVEDGEELELQTMTMQGWCFGFMDHDAFRSVFLPSWRLVDINFDGYADIYCLQGVGGNRGNQFYAGWVYNPQTGGFDEVDLGDIYNPVVDSGIQRIRYYSTNTAGSWTWALYRWEENTLVCDRRLEVEAEVHPEVEEGYLLRYREYVGDSHDPVYDALRTEQTEAEQTARYHTDELWAIDSGVFYDRAYTEMNGR